MIFSLFYSDLTTDAQKEILEKARIKNPKELNWDVYPITEFEIGNDEDYTLWSY